MANQPFYSSYDARRDSGQQVQSVLRQLTVVLYDLFKFLGNFVNTLIKEVSGR